jgi:hypothetical protein
MGCPVSIYFRKSGGSWIRRMTRIKEEYKARYSPEIKESGS